MAIQGYTGTLMWIDPTYEMVFLFFSNRVYQTRLNTKLYDLMVRPAVHEAIYEMLKEGS